MDALRKKKNSQSNTASMNPFELRISLANLASRRPECMKLCLEFEECIPVGSHGYILFAAKLNPPFPTGTTALYKVLGYNVCKKDLVEEPIDSIRVLLRVEAVLVPESHRESLGVIRGFPLSLQAVAQGRLSPWMPVVFGNRPTAAQRSEGEEGDADLSVFFPHLLGKRKRVERMRTAAAPSVTGRQSSLGSKARRELIRKRRRLSPQPDVIVLDPSADEGEARNRKGKGQADDGDHENDAEQEQEKEGGECADREQNKRPAEFRCPVTMEPFQDPYYLLEDGFTYERSVLLEWYQEDRKRTPMGIPHQGNGTMVKNWALLKDQPRICPITKEEMKDPMIILESGQTVEHDALLQALQKTLCKGKLFRLFGVHRTVTPFPNKALWKPEDSVYRKPFVMPPRKIYPGFIRSKIPPRQPVTSGLNGVPTSVLEEGMTYRNLFFENCWFRSGCFKSMKFINCLFRECFFDGNCWHCKVKNCKFQQCRFVTLMRMASADFLTRRIPGCSFQESMIAVEGIGRDQLISQLQRNGALQVDLQVYILDKGMQ